MKVKIEYLPLDELDKKYPYVSNEVFVTDGMTDAEIAKWYESRHDHINRVGIKVLNIEKV